MSPSHNINRMSVCPTNKVNVSQPGLTPARCRCVSQARVCFTVTTPTRHQSLPEARLSVLQLAVSQQNVSLLHKAKNGVSITVITQGTVSPYDISLFHKHASVSHSQWWHQQYVSLFHSHYTNRSSVSPRSKVQCITASRDTNKISICFTCKKRKEKKVY